MKKAGQKAGQTSYGFGVYTTNDVPGCANGGLLSGTDGPDKLDGGDGDDEIRGLGEKDSLSGGDGKDVIYGGPGDDSFIPNGKGADVIYGGDGDDEIQKGEGGDVIHGGDGSDLLDGSLDHRQRDELYCGKGKDKYIADKNDYVDSSCEKKAPRGAPA